MQITIPIQLLIFLAGAFVSGIVTRKLTKRDRARGDFSSIGDAAIGALALAFFMSGLTITLIVVCVYLSW